jgi:hypothetical protein
VLHVLFRNHAQTGAQSDEIRQILASVLMQLRARCSIARADSDFHLQGMGSIADFEEILEHCRLALEEQTRAQADVEALPDSDFKDEMRSSIANSITSARNTEKLAREALARERAKLN